MQQIVSKMNLTCGNLKSLSDSPLSRMFREPFVSISIAIVLLCCINSCIGATLCVQTRIFGCPPVFIVQNVTRYARKTTISIPPPPPSYTFSSGFIPRYKSTQKISESLYGATIVRNCNNAILNRV